MEMRDYVRRSKFKKRIEDLIRENNGKVKRLYALLVSGKGGNYVLFLEEPDVEINNILLAYPRSDTKRPIFPYDFYVKSLLRNSEYRNKMIFFLGELLAGPDD